MDGTGRVGRLLISLILVEAGVSKVPLPCLSPVFKQYRDSHYRLLRQVRVNRDWEEWLLFFVDAIAAAATQAASAAQQLTQLHAADKMRPVQLGRPAGSAKRILDALFSHPTSNIAAL